MILNFTVTVFLLIATSTAFAEDTEVRREVSAPILALDGYCVVSTQQFPAWVKCPCFSSPAFASTLRRVLPGVGLPSSA